MARASGWQGTGIRSSGRKRVALFEDPPAHFGEGEAVLRRIEALEPARRLHRLEGHAAHAGLGQRELDDLAELVVVHPLLDRHDQGGRDVEPVQALERLFADAPQVGAAQRLERRARSESNCR